MWIHLYRQRHQYRWMFEMFVKFLQCVPIFGGWVLIICYVTNRWLHAPVAAEDQFNSKYLSASAWELVGSCHSLCFERIGPSHCPITMGRRSCVKRTFSICESRSLCLFHGANPHASSCTPWEFVLLAIGTWNDGSQLTSDKWFCHELNTPTSGKTKHDLFDLICHISCSHSSMNVRRMEPLKWWYSGKTPQRKGKKGK